MRQHILVFLCFSSLLLIILAVELKSEDFLVFLFGFWNKPLEELFWDVEIASF